MDSISSGVVEKIQRGDWNEDTSQTFEESNPVAKAIMKCWDQSWKEKETNGMGLEFYVYHEKWKQLFSEIKR